MSTATTIPVPIVVHASVDRRGGVYALHNGELRTLQRLFRHPRPTDMSAAEVIALYRQLGITIIDNYGKHNIRFRYETPEGDIHGQFSAHSNAKTTQIDKGAVDDARDYLIKVGIVTPAVVEYHGLGHNNFSVFGKEDPRFRVVKKEQPVQKLDQEATPAFEQKDILPNESLPGNLKPTTVLIHKGQALPKAFVTILQAPNTRYTSVKFYAALMNGIAQASDGSNIFLNVWEILGSEPDITIAHIGVLTRLLAIDTSTPFTGTFKEWMTAPFARDYNIQDLGGKIGLALQKANLVANSPIETFQDLMFTRMAHAMGASVDHVRAESLVAAMGDDPAVIVSTDADKKATVNPANEKTVSKPADVILQQKKQNTREQREKKSSPQPVKLEELYKQRHGGDFAKEAIVPKGYQVDQTLAARLFDPTTLEQELDIYAALSAACILSVKKNVECVRVGNRIATRPVTSVGLKDIVLNTWKILGSQPDINQARFGILMRCFMESPPPEPASKKSPQKTGARHPLRPPPPAPPFVMPPPNNIFKPFAAEENICVLAMFLHTNFSLRGGDLCGANPQRRHFFFREHLRKRVLRMFYEPYIPKEKSLLPPDMVREIQAKKALARIY